MPKTKLYIEGKNVVQAAFERLSYCHDNFDHLLYMFSGGKDSLTCLELARAFNEKNGLGPVKAVFRDEELIPDSVVGFVQEIRSRPWVKLEWFAVQMLSQKFCLGENQVVIQWDWNREWLREKPAFAITLPRDDNRVFSEWTMDGFIYDTLGLSGKVGFITGVRAAESISRYRSIVNKPNLPFICNSSDARVKLIKPIYDWEENDVMKFLYESGQHWCSQYDAMHLSETPLRVATPLHAEAAAKFGQWRKIDPVFYSRLIKLFPEMQAHERYWAELDRKQDFVAYLAQGVNGAARYVIDTITDPVKKRQAMKLTSTYCTLHKNDPLAYPLRPLFMAISKGVVNRMLLPLPKEAQQREQLTTKKLIDEYLQQ